QDADKFVACSDYICPSAKAQKSKGKGQISKGRHFSFLILETGSTLLPFDICPLPFDFPHRPVSSCCFKATASRFCGSICKAWRARVSARARSLRARKTVT